LLKVFAAVVPAQAPRRQQGLGLKSSWETNISAFPKRVYDPIRSVIVQAGVKKMPSSAVLCDCATGLP